LANSNPWQIEGPLLTQAEQCEPILRALPDWFGIEGAIRNYVGEIDGLPTWIARVDGQTVGFMTLKLHNAYAAEVYVMGVIGQFQGLGLGQALVGEAEAALAREGVEYLQVKTLSPSNPDPAYARTRAFYQALGFRPLEEFKQLWDEDNPCLMMIKYIKNQSM
jgi:ribosomal protein S18 acetylase RimI-like enzyme